MINKIQASWAFCIKLKLDIFFFFLSMCFQFFYPPKTDCTIIFQNQVFVLLAALGSIANMQKDIYTWFAIRIKYLRYTGVY